MPIIASEEKKTLRENRCPKMRTCTFSTSKNLRFPRRTSFTSQKTAKIYISQKMLTHKHLRIIISQGNRFAPQIYCLCSAICRFLQRKIMGLGRRKATFGKTKTMLLASAKVDFATLNAVISIPKASNSPYSITISPILFVKYFYYETENSYS